MGAAFSHQSNGRARTRESFRRLPARNRNLEPTGVAHRYIWRSGNEGPGCSRAMEMLYRGSSRLARAARCKRSARRRCPQSDVRSRVSSRPVRGRSPPAQDRKQLLRTQGQAPCGEATNRSRSARCFDSVLTFHLHRVSGSQSLRVLQMLSRPRTRQPVSWTAKAAGRLWALYRVLRKPRLGECSGLPRQFFGDACTVRISTYAEHPRFAVLRVGAAEWR